jgi:hypothetical protein
MTGKRAANEESATQRVRKPKAPGLDRLVIETLFHMKYRPGMDLVPFARTDYDEALLLVAREYPDRFKKADQAAKALSDAEEDALAATAGMTEDPVGIPRHKNIGAVIYDYRFRRKLPPRIAETERPEENKFWRIQLAGRGEYRFRLGPDPIIVPGPVFDEVEVFESTPEIIAEFRIEDEQALLAKIRYNRLIDTFLGITAYSLQNHLRTAVPGIGQIEIDELYIGHDGKGDLFVVPVQAKGKSDKLSSVQTEQDLAFCRESERFSVARARCVSAQFLPDGSVHLFEMAEVDGNAEVKRETRYHFRRSVRSPND